MHAHIRNVTNEAYNHCYVNSFAAFWQTTHTHKHAHTVTFSLCTSLSLSLSLLLSVSVCCLLRAACVWQTFWGIRNLLAHVNINKRSSSTPEYLPHWFPLPLRHTQSCVETLEHELQKANPPHLISQKKKTLNNAEELHYYHRYFRHCSVCQVTPTHSHTCTHKENDRDRDVIAGSQHHVGNKQFERSLKSWSAKKSRKKNQTEIKKEKKRK